MTLLPLIPKLKGKGLFVFSDPGGAKPLLSLITLAKIQDSVTVVSDRSYHFFAEFSIPVISYSGNVAKLIAEIRPDYVFTGTSYTSTIEREIIQEASNQGVPTHSFLDHYTCYAERFRMLSGEFCLPDWLYVHDARAKDLATALLPLDPSKIFVSGNYYYALLGQWVPTVGVEEFRRRLGIPSAHKLITFAPDPVSNLQQQEFVNWNEHTVFQYLLSVLSQADSESYTLLVQAHPNQDFARLFADYAFDETLLLRGMNEDLRTLLFYSDVVIGMFSSVLIEAEILKTPVIRCLVGFQGADPLLANSVGLLASDSDVFEKAVARLFIG